LARKRKKGRNIHSFREALTPFGHDVFAGAQMQLHPANEQPSEQSLVKLYMELTGASEAAARNVYASVCSEQFDEDQDLATLGQFDAAPRFALPPFDQRKHATL
jgi:hypothetical protein